MFADPMHIAYTLMAAAAATIVAIYLIQFVPLRVQQEWRQAASDFGYGTNAPLDPAGFVLSGRDRAIVGASILAIGIGLLAWRGWSAATGLLFIYFSALVIVTAINVRHVLLPDLIVLPMMWLGLLQHALWSADPQYIVGAALGYTLPYVLLKLVEGFTGKAFLGYGDLKAFALAGAWFGATRLPTVFVAFIALVIIQLIITAARRRHDEPMPTAYAHFGASIAAAVVPTIVV